MGSKTKYKAACLNKMIKLAGCCGEPTLIAGNVCCGNPNLDDHPQGEVGHDERLYRHHRYIAGIKFTIVELGNNDKSDGFLDAMMTLITKIIKEKSKHRVKETEVEAIDLYRFPDVIDLGQLRMNHWRTQRDAHFMNHEGFLHTILIHIGNIRLNRVWEAAQKGHANPTAGEPSHSIVARVENLLMTAKATDKPKTVTCPECNLNLPSCDVIVCATCPKLRWCHDCHQKVLEIQENRATAPANNPSCLTCRMGPHGGINSGKRITKDELHKKEKVLTPLKELKALPKGWEEMSIIALQPYINDCVPRSNRVSQRLTRALKL